MNGVIKTIAPLAPLCSGAQESLIGAASAHRQCVTKRFLWSTQDVQGPEEPRAARGTAASSLGQPRALRCKAGPPWRAGSYQLKALSLWEASGHLQ